MSPIYTTLPDDGKHFRTLTIEPAASGPLRCTLNVVRFSEDIGPEYETISYVWGDPHKCRSIVVNGHELPVPQSSWIVLNRVRLPGKPRVVWIDAVCINQDNSVERGHQVSIMGEIFRKTTCGLIFWCEEDSCITPALHAIADLFEEANSADMLDVLFDEYKSINLNFGYKIKTRYDSRALARFFTSEWTRRVWTFQEAVLPSMNYCLCGDREIDLRALTMVGAWLCSLLASVDSDLWHAAKPLGRLFKYGLIHQAGEPEAITLSCLANLRVRHCSLPVDSIYGSLGILGHCNIIPDYKKSPDEVFQEFAVWHITNSFNLAILTAVQHDQDAPASSLFGRPSWIPDWSQPFLSTKYSDPVSMYYFVGGYGNQQGRLRFDLSGRAILVVRGNTLGRISTTAELHEFTTEAYTQFGARELFWDSLKDQADREVAETAIAMTLCAGIEYPGKRVGPEIVSSYRALMRRVGPFRWVGDAEPGVYSEENMLASRYFLTLGTSCNKRKAFCTTLGRIGIGPRRLEAGDIVAVFYGYHSPVLLRPRGAQFEYLGEAYVHGVMDGEAVEREEETDGRDVTFEIC